MSKDLLVSYVSETGPKRHKRPFTTPRIRRAHAKSRSAAKLTDSPFDFSGSLNPRSVDVCIPTAPFPRQEYSTQGNTSPSATYAVLSPRPSTESAAGCTDGFSWTTSPPTGDGSLQDGTAGEGCVFRFKTVATATSKTDQPKSSADNYVFCAKLDAEKLHFSPDRSRIDTESARDKDGSTATVDSAIASRDVETLRSLVANMKLCNGGKSENTHSTSKTVAEGKGQVVDQGLERKLTWALRDAVLAGQCEMVAALVDLVVDVNHANVDNVLLRTAMERGNEEIFWILTRKCDVTMTSSLGGVLHAAVWFNKSVYLKHFLDKEVLDVNAKDELNGATPLIMASMRGHARCVEILLKRGCDLDLRDKNGQTALHFAAIVGSLHIAKLLVDAGADILATDNNSHTPWMCATKFFNNMIVRYLAERGGIPKPDSNPNKMTCLHMAAETANTECINILIQDGYDPSALDLHGRTPVMVAVQHGRVESAHALLDACASPEILNHRCSSRLTALHHALTPKLSASNERLITELAKAGADLNLPNSSQVAPVLDHFNKDEFLKSLLLMKLGARVDVIDLNMETVLSKAFNLLSMRTGFLSENNRLLITSKLLLVNSNLDECDRNLIIQALGNSDNKLAVYIFYSGFQRVGLLGWMEKRRCEKGNFSGEGDNSLYEAMYRVLRQPCRLKAITRRVILLTMGQHHQHQTRMRQLGLPESMVDYLNHEKFIAASMKDAERTT